MPRVRQTFTNRLPEAVRIWVELDCWCFLLQPEERLTVEFDAEGGDWNPLPVDLMVDGGDSRRLVVMFTNQGPTEPSFFINDEAVIKDGEFTPYGRQRYVD
jgi:hypothetical protein